MVERVECGLPLGENEAQAVRWGWWSNGVGDLCPFCEKCGEREFGAELPPPALGG